MKFIIKLRKQFKLVKQPRLVKSILLIASYFSKDDMHKKLEKDEGELVSQKRLYVDRT